MLGVNVRNRLTNDDLFPFILNTLKSLPTGAECVLQQLVVGFSFINSPVNIFDLHCTADECKELDIMLAGEMSPLETVRVGLVLDCKDISVQDQEKCLEIAKAGYPCCFSAQEKGSRVVIFAQSRKLETVN